MCEFVHMGEKRDIACVAVTQKLVSCAWGLILLQLGDHN